MKLEVVGGSFKFKKTDYILRDINFSLEDSDILSILGPNGVGKTTLIRCLTGLLQWTEGGTYLDGKNISSINNREFWSKVSYIPQKRNSTFSFSGLDMVLFGAKSSLSIFEKPRACDIKKASQVMKMVGIYNLKDKKTDQMSGGELQMLLIARSLMKDPKMIILDEPESGLDYRNQKIILDLLKELSKKGVIIVMNTHYPEHALSRSNKCLILNYDKTYEVGRTREVLKRENLKKSFSIDVNISEIEVKGKKYDSIIPLDLDEGDKNFKL